MEDFLFDGVDLYYRLDRLRTLEEEFPVVEGITKKGTGASTTDAYDVKTGCYRIEVGW